jgi:hypothetical protein
MVGDQQKKYPLCILLVSSARCLRNKMDNCTFIFLPLFDDADEIVEHPLVGHHGALTKASYLLQIITPYTPEVVQPIF